MTGADFAAPGVPEFTRNQITRPILFFDGAAMHVAKPVSW
jgi:hypothetical protein